jgi:hypothetical protein
MTDAEYKAKRKFIDRLIERRLCADPKRRKRLEKKPADWLRHYMRAAFPMPFSDGHLQMIDGALQSARTGTGVAVAGPRGEGKTTILRGVCLFLVATGQARFPVLAGWTHKSATEGFRVWLRMLHSSKEFRADYPEFTQPFEQALHPARIKRLMWADNEDACGADLRTVDRCIVLPDSRGAIAAGSVQGDVKGLNVTLADGTALRPDLLLIDDAQDPGRADDPTFVADTVETIEKQWMCLAGPQTRISTMVACTVAAAGDVSEHFLSRPDFKSVRISRVVSWPDGWDEKASETRKLWDDWHDALLSGFHDGDGGEAGRKFYLANKPAMTRGMSVSWAHRFDKKRGDPDAMYSAMFDLYRVGEAAFASEYQNKPLKQGVTIYNLTPAVIQSRATDRRPGDVPEWSRLRIAATDINPSYGLTWGICSFGSDQTAAVLGYGIHEMSVAAGATEAEARRAMYENLVAHGRTLAALPCRPELWFIDAGGAAFDVVLDFAVNSVRIVGLQAVPCTGQGARQYKPWGKNVIGVAKEYCHQSADARGRKWVKWHADYWREAAQKAWTGSIGAPGSCSLPVGNHREFAEQVCREQLAGKAEIAGQMVWVWHTAPGAHDYGDVMAMCFMGAAWGGIGTAGQERALPVKKKSRPRSGGVVYL